MHSHTHTRIRLVCVLVNEVFLKTYALTVLVLLTLTFLAVWPPMLHNPPPAPIPPTTTQNLPLETNVATNTDQEPKTQSQALTYPGS
jgi:hypothetical protein